MSRIAPNELHAIRCLTLEAVTRENRMSGILGSGSLET